MKTIPLDLPEGCSVSNHLYPSMGIGYLLSDLVAVELPDGSIIDAGWYPEHDPGGHYFVRYYRVGRPKDVVPDAEARCTTPQEVKRAIELMVLGNEVDNLSMSELEAIR